MQIIKEVCVDSLFDAQEAEKNGANRIELCSRLDLDGLTPSKSLIQNVLSKIQIPVRIMIRPHPNGFIYNKKDINEMYEVIKFCKSLKVDGIVTGCLDKNNELNSKERQVEFSVERNRYRRIMLFVLLIINVGLLGLFYYLVMKK